MKLKNEALQKLYDKLASDTFAFNVVEQSIINEIFKRCDEELSDSITFAQIKDLQDRCDILERSNEVLLSANMEAISKNRRLEKQVMETTETLEKVNADRNELQRHIDILSVSEREALSANKKLEKDLADAKKQIGYFTTSRDNWRSRAKHAEEEVEGLKKKLDFQQNDIDRLRKDRDRKDEAIAKLAEIRDELQKERDSYRDLYAELSKAYDELSADNKKLKAKADFFANTINWSRKHCKEQSAKIGELKSRLNSMYDVKYGEYVRSRDTGYKNGQINLWNMLQNVNDAKPFELATCFPDVSCMDDILSWDLEDFLDAYKSWQEKNEHERIIKDACDAFYYGFKAGLASEVPVD